MADLIFVCSRGCGECRVRLADFETYRAVNLRNVSHSGNNQNVPKYFKGSEGRPMGVTRHQGKWMAQIQHERQHIYIGVFDSASEAGRAYLERKRLLHVEGYSPDMHTSRV